MTKIIFPLMLLPCLVCQSVAQQSAEKNSQPPSSFHREPVSTIPVSFSPPATAQKISAEQVARIQGVLDLAGGKSTDHVTLKNILLTQAVNPAIPAAGEQLVYVAEIANNTGQDLLCSFVILKTFDAAGGLVDLFYLGGGSFAPSETIKKSGIFPIRPDCIDRLSSLSLESRCSVKQQR